MKGRDKKVLREDSHAIQVVPECGKLELFGRKFISQNLQGLWHEPEAAARLSKCRILHSLSWRLIVRFLSAIVIHHGETRFFSGVSKPIVSRPFAWFMRPTPGLTKGWA